jgi:hypothetical protein
VCPWFESRRACNQTHGDGDSWYPGGLRHQARREVAGAFSTLTANEQRVTFVYRWQAREGASAISVFEETARSDFGFRTARLMPGWPNLFVVGVGRGGTTSLWAYLGRHPDVYMSPEKEPHFFSRWVPAWREVVKDEQQYLALFAAASGERWRGEASPSYIWDESVPAKIQRVSPSARIVISLREPVERAHSLYWHLVKSGLERRTFERAICEELDAGPGTLGDDPWLTYLDRGLYAGRVVRYCRAFAGQVHVVFFEELIEDPRREMRKLFEFLQVDPDAVDNACYKAHNAFARPRGRLVGHLLNSPGATRIARTLVPPQLRRPVRSLLVTGRGRPAVDADLKARLDAFYTTDRAKLEHVLGRPAPW